MSASEQDRRTIQAAAALKYNPEQDSAPVVVAAGAGHMAQRIIEIAAQNGISVYHDNTAATLLSKLKLGQEVPPDLYRMVVDIYVAIMAAAEHAKRPLPEKKQAAPPL